MGDLSFKDGAKHGRNGSDPSPPSHNLLHNLVGVSKEDVEEMRKDYLEGYKVGTQQRVADESSE